MSNKKNDFIQEDIFDKLSYRIGEESLTQPSNQYDSIAISVSSDEEILRRSCGEVTSPETIHYRTLKPIPNGLCDQKIFGPCVDYECACGISYPPGKESICERCEVLITSSDIRRHRMGHIVLKTPVINYLFLNKIHLFTDISIINLYNIVNFESYVVVKTREGSKFKDNQIIEQTLFKKLTDDGVIGNDETDDIIMSGSEAILAILKKINLIKLKEKTLEQLNKTNNSTVKKKLIKKLGLIDSFIKNKKRPETFIMNVFPVLAAALRPITVLENGKTVASEKLTKLYQNLYNQNYRLGRSLEHSEISLDIIANTEKKIIANTCREIFEYFSSMLQGKSGLIRNKILGKRVDYSGRAVITTNDKLKIGECGIPKTMLKELFRPFIYRDLKKYKVSSTIAMASENIDYESKEVWDILDNILQDSYILLNRAPTLYKLGIQAFKPKMIEGDSIQLHPLSCSAFNADFDGDQMAIYVPLFEEAQAEAKNLLNARCNILSPVSGEPIIGPTKDMILGLTYLTYKKESKVDKKLYFDNLGDVEYFFV